MTRRPWKEGLDTEKFEAAVLYLLKGCSSHPPGITALVKMVWYADYWHYRQHLSTVTGARYVALPEGPVVDDYRGLFYSLKGAVGVESVPIQGKPYPKEEFRAAIEPNERLLSESELEVLDTVIERCGRSSGMSLSRRTHREGPWSWIWDDTSPGLHIPYMAFRWLDNVPDEEDLRAARESIESDPDLLNTIRRLIEGSDND